MPRTTIALDDDLLRSIKEKAAREGRTFQAVANELLRVALVEQRTRHAGKLQLKGWRARQQPGVDLTDRDKLFDLMDGR